MDDAFHVDLDPQMMETPGPWTCDLHIGRRKFKEGKTCRGQ